MYMKYMQINVLHVHSVWSVFLVLLKWELRSMHVPLNLLQLSISLIFSVFFGKNLYLLVLKWTVLIAMWQWVRTHTKYNQ